MTQSISQGFEYLSKSELIQKLRQIKDSHIPSSQAIYIIKQLLSSVPEPELIKKCRGRKVSRDCFA